MNYRLRDVIAVTDPDHPGYWMVVGMSLNPTKFRLAPVTLDGRPRRGKHWTVPKADLVQMDTLGQAPPR